MKYTKEFKKILTVCQKEQEFVGLGNPNAKILFIGKENAEENEAGSAKLWLEKKDFFSSFQPCECDEIQKRLRNRAHTWQKYQKLYEFIANENPKGNYLITFVENVFTTELNNGVVRTTSEAKRNKEFSKSLQKRKDIFFQSEFIQNFPIVVICASDEKYIKGSKGEVCDLFGVEYSNVIECSKTNKAYIHYAKKEAKVYPRLVIHTRQLTNGASNALLEEIANTIKKFAKENAIELKVK